jgi:hypothetical protein
MDESGCSDDKSHEEEMNVDGIERMEAEILSRDEKEVEEIDGNVPVYNGDNDNYGDKDSNTDVDEDLRPGIGSEELREPSVQDTDDVIYEVVETAHLLSAEQREVRVILRGTKHLSPRRLDCAKT